MCYNLIVERWKMAKGNSTKKLDEKRLKDYQDKIDEYFLNAPVPNICGMCLHLDITNTYFYDVLNEAQDKNYNQELVRIFTRARMKLEDIIVTKASLGEYNPQISNKILESKYGYVSKKQIEADVKQVVTTKCDLTNEQLQAIIDNE